MLNAADAFSDFIADGVQWAIPSSASLTTAMTSGTAYLNSVRTLVPAVSGYSFPASNDTYVSFNNSGTVDYQSVANGATAPTPNSGYVQTHLIITDSSGVTEVVPLIALSPNPTQFLTTSGYNILAFGASGSNENTTGSITASGNILTLSEPIDFKNGQGISVVGAGPQPTVSSPSSGTVTTVGASGSTSYDYYVCSIDNLMGISAPSPVFSTSTGNASLDLTNYNQFQFVPPISGIIGANINIAGYLIYGRTPTSSNFIGFMRQIPYISQQPLGATLISTTVGPNLVANTTYEYSFTTVDFNGNESPLIPYGNQSTTDEALSVILGSTAEAVQLGTFNIGDNTQSYTYKGLYQYINIYKNGYFLDQIPWWDTVYVDYGFLATTTQTPPTMMTFSDIGQSLIGNVGVPFATPISLPSGTVGETLYTTIVSGGGTTELTVADVANTSVSSQGVFHDDSPAFTTAINYVSQNPYNGASIYVPGNGLHYRIRGVTTPEFGGITFIGSDGWSMGGTQDAQLESWSLNNTIPPSSLPVLLFTDLFTPGLSLWGAGASIKNMALLWPYQISGANNNGNQCILPYPPGLLLTNGNDQRVENIVDYNSFLGIYLLSGWVDSLVHKVWSQTLNHCIYTERSQSEIFMIHNDAGILYAAYDAPSTSTASVIRWIDSGSDYTNKIHHLGCDRVIPLWYTVMGNGGATISDTWTDDQPYTLILDSGTSIYEQGSVGFQFKISNIPLVPGTGFGYIINAPYSSTTNGSNPGNVQFTNCDLVGSISGNLTIQASNCSWGNVALNATVGRSASTDNTEALLYINLSNCLWGTPRWIVNGYGEVYAVTSNCASPSSRIPPLYDEIASTATFNWEDKDTGTFSQDLIVNGDFKQYHQTNTLWASPLEQATGINQQIGTWTFGSSGAVSGADNSILIAGHPNATPVISNTGSIPLPLTFTGTFTTPGTIPSSGTALIQLQAYQNAENYYQMVADETSSLLIINKVANGTLTQMASVSFTATVDTEYTATLKMTFNSTANITLSGSIGSTNIEIGDGSALPGGFQGGYGADTGVIITNCSISGPWPDGWSGGNGLAAICLDFFTADSDGLIPSLGYYYNQSVAPSSFVALGLTPSYIYNGETSTRVITYTYNQISSSKYTPLSIGSGSGLFDNQGYIYIVNNTNGYVSHSTHIIEYSNNYAVANIFGETSGTGILQGWIGRISSVNGAWSQPPTTPHIPYDRPLDLRQIPYKGTGASAIIIDADGHGVDTEGNATFNTLNSGNATFSTLNSTNSSVIDAPTSGTVTLAMPLQGSGGKQVILTFDAYENDTTTAQTINFPTAFGVTPLILGNNTGLTLTASTTGVTITAPDSTTTYSGTAVIMGN